MELTDDTLETLDKVGKMPNTPTSALDIPSWIPPEENTGDTRRFLRRSLSRQQSSEPPTPTTGDMPKAVDTFRRNKAAAGKALLRDRHR
jgi:hypothetical protein